jgi:hypothetical protein
LIEQLSVESFSQNNAFECRSAEIARPHCNHNGNSRRTRPEATKGALREMIEFLVHEKHPSHVTKLHGFQASPRILEITQLVDGNKGYSNIPKAKSRK